ncbi:chaplin [Streptomyces sp. NPDC054784]
MRQVTKKGLITVAAAGGVLALSGGTAFADSGAQGAASDSPGVLSGNTIQLPVHVPVNLCGNTIDVVGLLNPAFGNTCVNDDSGSEPKPETPHTPEPPKAETPSEEPEAPQPEAPEQAPEEEARTLPQTETQLAAEPETQLAATGNSYDLALGLSLGGGLLLTGGVLYRRNRAARQH